MLIPMSDLRIRVYLSAVRRMVKDDIIGSSDDQLIAIVNALIGENAAISIM